MGSLLKKSGKELELLTNIAMLLMVEKGYAKANNKYMKNYNKDNRSLYIQYLDANNLYGWAMSEKIPVNGFKWKKIHLNSVETS